MTISEARIKVSFTEEEVKALGIVDNIFNEIRVKDPMAFLTAFIDGNWYYYDRDNTDNYICYEFEDNNPSEDN